MFFKNLLPGTLEHILELNERSSVVKANFFCRFIKVEYCLIGGEFDSIKPAILRDLDFVFVARTRTHQLINLGEDSFFVPRLLQFEGRWLFTNACHFWLCRTLVLEFFCFFHLLPSKVELFKQCVTARGETIASVIVKRVKRV